MLDTRKAPFPWPGGKRQAAPTVWALLGDTTHYIEPFFGSGAVLLNRPHEVNRSYYSETVGDADGYLVNFWRALRADPDGVADAASWPVTEADKHARTIWLLTHPPDVDRLCGDPDWHDVKTAGWWVWSVAVQIGDWPGRGPWWPDDTGRLARRPTVRGITRELPHLGDDGKGVNRPTLREPGVTRELPHIGSDGRGVNHPKLREPGLGDPHPIVMPELTRWLGLLAARLRHVRVVHGDWRRTIGTGAALTMSVRAGKGPCGVFLDPPYDGKHDSYVAGGDGVAVDAARWAVGVGDDPRWRIVAAGYAEDAAHDVYLTAGWTEHEWYTVGHLTGGYKGRNGGHARSRRERLYASPHCLPTGNADPPTLGLR